MLTCYLYNNIKQYARYPWTFIQKKKSFILFITGYSCTGKSTLFRSLQRTKKISKSVLVYDIDEQDIAVAGRKYWRTNRVKELLNVAIANLKKKKSTIICGIMRPQEVLDFELIVLDLPIYYLLLDSEFKDFNRRMRTRLNTLGRREDFPQIKVASRILRNILRTQVLTQENHFLIDTSRSDKRATLKKTLEIIESLMK